MVFAPDPTFREGLAFNVQQAARLLLLQDQQARTRC